VSYASAEIKSVEYSWVLANYSMYAMYVHMGCLLVISYLDFLSCLPAWPQTTLERERKV